MATTQTKLPELEIREADIKKLVRNSLMIAGKEMGETGDHWPVIKNTITDVMRDWEELEIERAVHAEIKTHLAAYLAEMEELVKSCNPAVQKDMAPRLAELRAVFEAAFETPELELIDITDEEDADKPIHIRRAEAIIDTLFDDTAMEVDHA